MGEKKPRFTIFRKISPFSLAKCFSLCYNIDTERQKGAFRPSPCGVLCPAHDFIGIIPQRATSAHPFFCPRPPPPRTGTLFVPSRFPAKKMRSSQPCLPPFPAFLSPPSRHARHLPFPKGEVYRGVTPSRTIGEAWLVGATPPYHKARHEGMRGTTGGRSARRASVSRYTAPFPVRADSSA